MKTNINTEKCIAVGKNLIYKENSVYILEVYEATIEGKEYYKTYGTFNNLISAMDTAKRINRTRDKLKDR